MAGLESLLVGAIAALIAGLIAWAAGRRKASSESINILTGTALSLVEPLRLRVNELEARVNALEAEVILEKKERLWRELHAAALIEQLHAAGVPDHITLAEIRILYPNPHLRE